METQINAKENEISLLQGELKEKCVIGKNLYNENNTHRMDVKNITCEYDKYTASCNNLDTNSRTLEERIKQLDLQVSTLNGQNNLMATSVSEKEKRVYHLQAELDKLNSRLGQSMGEAQALNNSICNLYGNKSSEKLEISVTPKEEDVIIIHDSLFKDISEGLLKKDYS